MSIADGSGRGGGADALAGSPDSYASSPPARPGDNVMDVWESLKAKLTYEQQKQEQQEQQQSSSSSSSRQQTSEGEEGQGQGQGEGSGADGMDMSGEQDAEDVGNPIAAAAAAGTDRGREHDDLSFGMEEVGFGKYRYRCRVPCVRAHVSHEAITCGM